MGLHRNKHYGAYLAAMVGILLAGALHTFASPWLLPGLMGVIGACLLTLGIVRLQPVGVVLIAGAVIIAGIQIAVAEAGKPTTTLTQAGYEETPSVVYSFNGLSVEERRRLPQ